MFRYVFDLIGLLILFSVIRGAISWAMRLFASTIQQQPQAQARAAASVMQSAGELQRDPVCGTFVPVASSLKRVVSGRPVYFCSPECRDRF